MRLTLTSIDENSILPTFLMMKDTKTYRCDGCEKQKVLDFWSEASAEKLFKEIADWITIRLSATQQGKPSVIPETIGHACCVECVKPAIANIVKKKLPA